MANSKAERVKASAWIALAVLALFYTLSFIDRQILSMMVEPIKHDLRLTDLEISLLLGLAFALLYTFAGLAMGAIVDRYPRRLVVFVGAAFWSLATAACGLAGSFGHLFAARMAVGIGEATLTPAAYSILSDIFPRRRLSLAIAIFTMGSSLGTALSLAGGGILITALSTADPLVLPLLGVLRPWQSVFLLLGVAGLFLSFLIFATPEPARSGGSDAAAQAPPSWGQALHWVSERRQLWLAVLMTFVPMAILATITAVWTPTYMARNFGWTPARFGVALAVCYALPHALGQLFNGAMVDRLFARGMIDAHFRYFMIIAIISVIAGSTAYLVGTPRLFLMLLPVPCFLLFAGGGFGAAALQMLTPSRLRGRIGGLYMVFVTLPSLILGPTLVALVAKYVFRSEAAFGSAIALIMVILLPVMIAGSFIGMRAMRKLVPVMLAEDGARPR